VALLSNATDNNFTGVTFYCDDAATALGLPVNPRASAIAGCAGKPTEVRTASSLTQYLAPPPPPRAASLIYYLPRGGGGSCL